MLLVVAVVIEAAVAAAVAIAVAIAIAIAIIVAITVAIVSNRSRISSTARQTNKSDPQLEHQPWYFY